MQRLTEYKNGAAALNICLQDAHGCGTVKMNDDSRQKFVICPDYLGTPQFVSTDGNFL
jgi:hypothetical protein